MEARWLVEWGRWIRRSYTGGRLPSSLFMAFVSDRMCHDSSVHLWWNCCSVSITVAPSQSIACDCCAATADCARLPLVRARLCSFSRWAQNSVCTVTFLSIHIAKTDFSETLFVTDEDPRGRNVSLKSVFAM